MSASKLTASSDEIFVLCCMLAIDLLSIEVADGCGQCFVKYSVIVHVVCLSVRISPFQNAFDLCESM